MGKKIQRSCKLLYFKVSLSFNFRIGTATVCQIVKDIHVMLFGMPSNPYMLKRLPPSRNGRRSAGNSSNYGTSQIL